MSTDDKVTECYELLRTLTPSHYIALDQLESGATHQSAAQAAGVHRVTVSRWVRQHPAFQAELNRRCRERSERIAAKLGEITFDALDVIHDAIRDNDTETALAFMRLIRIDEVRMSQREASRHEPVTADAILDEEACRAEHARLYQFRNPLYRDLVVLERATAINEPINST